MKKGIKLLLLGLSLGTGFDSAVASNWQGYATAGLGLTMTKHAQDITLSSTPLLINRYVSESNSHPSFLLGAGLDELFMTFKKGAELRFGLEGLYIRNDGANGTIFPFINGGSFDTRNFKYDIDNYLVLAKGRLNKAKLIKSWDGYFDFGVGASINRLSSYKEYRPQSSSSVPMLQPFGKASTTKFAVSLGGGVSHKVGKRSAISVGYRYINSGNGVLMRSSTYPVALSKLKSAALGHHMLVMSVRA